MLDNFSYKDQTINSPEHDQVTFNEDLNASDFEDQFQAIQNRHTKSKQVNQTRSSVPMEDITFGGLGNQSEMYSANFNQNDMICRYTIYWISRRENNKLYMLDVDIPYKDTVFDAIQTTIPYLNQYLDEEGSNYVLSNDANLFEFYKAKKTGVPSHDYPVLDADQVLSQTGIRNLTLLESSITAVSQRKSQFFDNISQQKHKPTMVSSTMPGGNTIMDIHSNFSNEYIEETVCFCWTVRKKVSLQELNAKLLS